MKKQGANQAKKLTPSSAIVDPSIGKGKEIVGMTEDIVRSTSSAVQLTPFFDVVAKVFS